MFTARTERNGFLSTHLGSPARRPVTTECSRPSNRSFQGAGRLVLVDIAPSTHLNALRGSMFDPATPHRA